MAEGFRTRDPVTNAVRVTLDTHLTKILGFFNTGLADGSIADANLARGNPFVATLPSDGTSGKVPPTVVASGSGISWSWNGNPPTAGRLAVDVAYGIWT